jgi:hypothetical protein
MHQCIYFHVFFLLFVVIFVSASLPILNVPVPVPNDNVILHFAQYTIYIWPLRSVCIFVAYEQRVCIFAVSPKDLIDAQAILYAILHEMLEIITPWCVHGVRLCARG